MKISPKIKINETIKFSTITTKRIIKGNYPRKLYFLCTSPFHETSFEIVKGQYLDERYKDCYLLALSKDKDFLLEQVQWLVDGLYNTKDITYEGLVKDVNDTMELN